MLSPERLLEIEEEYGSKVRSIIPNELDGETLRIVLHLKVGSNLRVIEQWSGTQLERHSYYWLTATNKLKIDWDNAPHPTRLKSFPHHKHVGKQEILQPSDETCLEDVMNVILPHP
jgi:hypothetical protein